jgi:hypothetical protein
MREEFAGKTVSRILLERGAKAVIIVGKNNEKLRATGLELGSFGKVITNNTDIADPVELCYPAFRRFFRSARISM